MFTSKDRLGTKSTHSTIFSTDYIEIPPELISISRRNPFREINDQPNKLASTTEASTLSVLGAVVSLAGAVLGAMAEDSSRNNHGY